MNTPADGTRTGRDIVAAVCTEYDVPPARAEADTLDFLARLIERGIVSLAAQPAQPLSFQRPHGHEACDGR